VFRHKGTRLGQLAVHVATESVAAIKLRILHEIPSMKENAARTFRLLNCGRVVEDVAIPFPGTGRTVSTVLSPDADRLLWHNRSLEIEFACEKSSSSYER